MPPRGKVFAFLLAIVGIFANWFLILLAFFICIAASIEAQQTTIKAAFEGVTVGDVMTPRENLRTVFEDISITDLVNRMFNERHTGYPVLRNDDLVGMTTLDDAAAIKEVEQDANRVEKVMTTEVLTIPPMPM